MLVLNKRYVEHCPISDLRLHPRNPRQGDIGAIHTSMLRIGFYGALLAQEVTGYILVGNHRYQAALIAGTLTLPVIFVDVDDETALGILLADNRTGDLASYDEALLLELLEEARGAGTLEITGYDEQAMQALFEDANRSFVDPPAATTATSPAAALRPQEPPPPSGALPPVDPAAAAAEEADQPAPAPPQVEKLPPVEGRTDENATPELDEKRFVTRPGDVWILGNHRVVCGDSTVPTDVEKVMAGELADMLFTDPPYNVAYNPESRKCHFSPERLAEARLGEIKNDKMSPDAFRAFLDDVYTSANLVLKAGGGIYICHADTEGHHFRNAYIAQPWKLQSCLIWAKTVLVFGRADYHWMHEPVLYGWKAGAAHKWTGDRKQTTLITVPADHYNKAGSDTGGKYVHPTQKPVGLILRALENSSYQGDIVLDLFGGSGSTLIACEKSHRKARLVELDARFVDVIVRRWQAFTGLDAVLEADGRTFEQAAVEAL